MLNLFKKKETKVESAFPEPRAQFMGNVNLNEWPKGDHFSKAPWSLFVNARKNLSAKKTVEAEMIYREILAMPGLEPRHYMQAWLFMRYFLKVQPPAEVAKTVYGVIVEVCTSTGVMLVAGYADHKARSLHSSGGGVIWENPDNSLNGKIDALIHAGEQAINSISLPLMDTAQKPPTQMDEVLICIATPSGIYQGLGTGEFMSQNAQAGPILSAGTILLQNLQSLKK